MKAVYIEQVGGPEVLTYGDRPDPEPADDEVLIDVAAASVNAADWKQRRGSYADLAWKCRNFRVWVGRLIPFRPWLV